MNNFEFVKTNLEGVKVIKPKIYKDERGFFMESYNQKAFNKFGINNIFVQDNHSRSKKGVFRGFHFQTKHQQAKLVRVISGAVLDFAIDLRVSSVTYGKYITEELTTKNKKQLFIPRGFAHGFLTLEDDTELLYKCDDLYYSSEQDGVKFDDPKIGINWIVIQQKYNISKMILSSNDKILPHL